jgi:sialate O-acetylesterase
MKYPFYLLSVLCSLLTTWSYSQTSLPSFFSDNMVLQQQTEAVIWGTDKAKKKIRVSGSWGKSSQVITDENGRWKLKLSTPSAGGPYTLVIKGSSTLTFKDVLIGEVWLCSGQSNMQMPLRGNTSQPIIGSNEFILNSTNNNIRVFHTPLSFSRTPLYNINNKWQFASPATSGNFSAVAYFFAKKINSILGIPIGIIQTSWGASSIESWMDSATLASFKTVSIPEKTSIKDANTTHTMLYNSMLHPFIGFTIKGMLWYQGETNRTNSHEYHPLFSLLIQSWRKQWNQGSFPFYFVQIAPHAGIGTITGALLREAQLKTMKTVEQTGMAVTMDVGEKNMIHPAQKELVGNRLAYWAFSKDYNIPNIAFSGPVYNQIERNTGDSIIISFDYAEMGLNSFGKQLTDFEIAGADKVFYPAKAVFTKDRKTCITVWSEQVKNPISVRYGFKNWVEGCLYNIQGLPASSFRTDNW